jgi:hypothetical protein
MHYEEIDTGIEPNNLGALHRGKISLIEKQLIHQYYM